MEKLIKFYFTVLLLSLSLGSIAQNSFTEIVKTNLADATKLGEAYLNPLFKGVGVGINSGWYNSAKAKNLGKFDVRFVGTAAIAPQSDRTFDINSLGLTNTRPTNPNLSIAPTVVGKNVDGPSVKFSDNNGNSTSFVLPGGSGLSFIPSPQLQVTVGVIKNTDVSVRYTPKIGNYEFGKMQVLGIGAKHEITPLLFPGKIGKLVPIDIAVALAYNQIKFQKDFDGADQQDDSNSGKDLNQRIEGKFSGVTADLIVSKKLSVFTPFASISYNTSKTDLGLLGDYKIENPTFVVGGSTEQYLTLTDPVKYNQNDISGFRGNIGFELRFAFFRLYGAYSIAEYQAVTGGIGFGIGK